MKSVKVCDGGNGYKVYFASPFFTDEQVEREERLKSGLRKLGFDVFSPKEFFKVSTETTHEMRRKVFLENLNQIEKCDIIFAVTDGKDVGTIWEAGYAYGIRWYRSRAEFPSKFPIVVYYCETLKGGKFNLMLAESSDLVITEESELFRVKDIMNGMIRELYNGEIE